MTQDPAQLEPIDNFRSVGYSAGTTVLAANMPAVYSGKVVSQSRVINGDAPVAEDIELLYPHVDAGGLGGENGISFAQAVQDVEIWGGVIRNVRINAEYKRDPDYYGVATAGGKAVQCEAGCRDIEINGINIYDSHIGINSNVINHYEVFVPWAGTGRTSDIIVQGVYMERVDIPINVLNDFHVYGVSKAGTQRCHVSNFYNNNSGRMPDDVYEERWGAPRTPGIQYSNRVTGFIGNYAEDGIGIVGVADRGRLYFPSAQGTHWSLHNGLVMSHGGYFVHVSDGKYFNPQNTYGGIDSIISGWAETPSSYLEDIEYRLELNCDIDANESVLDGGPLPGC